MKRFLALSIVAGVAVLLNGCGGRASTALAQAVIGTDTSSNGLSGFSIDPDQVAENKSGSISIASPGGGPAPSSSAQADMRQSSLSACPSSSIDGVQMSQVSCLDGTVKDGVTFNMEGEDAVLVKGVACAFRVDTNLRRIEVQFQDEKQARAHTLYQGTTDDLSSQGTGYARSVTQGVSDEIQLLSFLAGQGDVEAKEAVIVYHEIDLTSNFDTVVAGSVFNDQTRMCVTLLQ